jgi:hypothetical protein
MPDAQILERWWSLRRMVCVGVASLELRQARTVLPSSKWRARFVCATVMVDAPGTIAWRRAEN